MPKAVHDLAKKLIAQGKSEDSAWAIANSKLGETSAIDKIIQEHHNPLDIPFGREVPDQETVAIPGSLSAVSIGSKKRTQELRRIIESCR